MSKKLRFIGIIVFTIMVLSACNIPTYEEPDQGDLVNKAFQTLAAQATQNSFETLVAQLTQVAQQPEVTPTMQIFPSSTSIVVTNTQIAPSATETKLSNTPTNTSLPNTKTPTPTATPIPCNIAKFVKDVTVPDGSVMLPKEKFTKIWRLTNVGTCTWTTDYDLVFVTGDRMDAPTVVDIIKKVAPGETIDLSVDMVAPESGGTYAGYWMLRNAKGARFGIGKDALGLFWVKIKVNANAKQVYSFTKSLCDAEWSSGTTKPMICPSIINEPIVGYITVDETPRREDGKELDVPGLISIPNNATKGWIKGIYPAWSVQTGDKFKTKVNCEYDSDACDVFFELRYKIGNGEEITLGSWHEKYEGKWVDIILDLSSLAGKNVSFILYVKNGNSSVENNALWIDPGIYR